VEECCPEHIGKSQFNSAAWRPSMGIAFAVKRCAQVRRGRIGSMGVRISDVEGTGLFSPGVLDARPALG